MIRLRHIVAIISLIVALGINAAAWAAQARAQTQNRAGLIVQMADGSVITRCVSFSEDSLTGYELLRRAKLPLAVEVGGMGPAVCKIGNTGCNYPQQSCFCQCNTLDASCTYWSYAQIKDGAWRVSPLGAAGSKVINGNVDGWRWGKGDGTTGELPPALAFDQICNAQPAAQSATLQVATAQATLAAVQPTLTPLQISTPLPAPTETPLPTPAPATTSTPAPAVAPSATQPAPTETPLPQPTTVTAAQSTSESANSAMPLLGFGAIVAVLVIGVAVARRRGGA
jgi:hypothetical protein